MKAKNPYISTPPECEAKNAKSSIHTCINVSIDHRKSTFLKHFFTESPDDKHFSPVTILAAGRQCVPRVRT